MSNFRERATEVKEAAAAERGNFEPNGMPKRVYKYWLDNSTGDYASLVRGGLKRENFCHFWRVVAIWAPLLFISKKIETFLSSKVGAALAILLVTFAVFAVITTAGAWKFVLLSAAVGAVIGGLITGIVLAFRKFWNKDWNDKASKIAFVTGMAVLALIQIAVLVQAVIESGWIVLAYVFGVILAITALVAVVVAITTYFEGKRAIAKAKQREYENSLSHEEYFEYMTLRSRKRQPGKVEKFFSGIVDFLIFGAQIVRVKKWKICPMVTIEG